jgi:cytochrome oxidase Cu insertion factor (SCO1/SenC/PrrC family)
MASVLTEPAQQFGSPSHQRRSRPLLVVIAVVIVLALLGALLGVLIARNSAPAPPPASMGIAENRTIPASVANIPLVNEHGQATSLGAFGGKIVVLASFLTSCQETCPLTTGAFLDMQRDVQSAGLGNKVVFIEASVDPGRDNPARLSAYARVTGANWPLLTGTPSNLASLWHFFHIYYQKVPEGNPPGIDWETGKPYTYDVNHSDGFLVFDQRLHERFVTGAAPDVRNLRLETTLQAMLDGEGLRDYSHPALDTWTVPQALQAIGWVAGRAIPSVT